MVEDLELSFCGELNRRNETPIYSANSQLFSINKNNWTNAISFAVCSLSALGHTYNAFQSEDPLLTSCNIGAAMLSTLSSYLNYNHLR